MKLTYPQLVQQIPAGSLVWLLHEGPTHQPSRAAIYRVREYEEPRHVILETSDGRPLRKTVGTGGIEIFLSEAEAREAAERAFTTQRDTPHPTQPPRPARKKDQRPGPTYRKPKNRRRW